MDFIQFMEKCFSEHPLLFGCILGFGILLIIFFSLYCIGTNLR